LAAIEFMKLHVEALFTHNSAGRLVCGNETGGPPAPRFFVGATADGLLWRSHADLPDDLERDLEAIAHAQSFSNVDWMRPIDSASLRARLEAVAPVQQIWAGPAFAFPTDLPASGNTRPVTVENADVLRPHLAPWIPDVLAGCPLMATILGDSAVAVCGSVRVTRAAHEAGVETAPPFRGRGFALPAVAAWARDIRARGIVPLYSTSWGNTASQALAGKLKLVQFGSDLHLT
jgi:hypothetical protein